MIVSRVGHTATLLRDGRVLLTGGDVLGTAELYVPPPDPWQQAFTAMKTAAASLRRVISRDRDAVRVGDPRQV